MHIVNAPLCLELLYIQIVKGDHRRPNATKRYLVMCIVFYYTEHQEASTIESTTKTTMFDILSKMGIIFTMLCDSPATIVCTIINCANIYHKMAMSYATLLMFLPRTIYYGL